MALLYLFVSFALGIGLGESLFKEKDLLLIFNTVFLISSIMSLRKRKLFAVNFFIFIFFLGAFWINVYNLKPQNHIKYILKENQFIKVEGLVINEPLPKKHNFSFILKSFYLLNRDRKIPIKGCLLVNLSKKSDIFYGDYLLLEGRLKRIPKFSLKSLDYQKYLKRKDIYFYLESDLLPQVISRKRANPLIYLAIRVKRTLSKIIEENLSPQSASLLKTVILGERRVLSPWLKSIFIKTGTAHILAISGLHVGIIGFISFLIFKVLRIPSKIRILLTMGVILFYCFLSGLRTSVIRATIMGMILLLGYLLDRDPLALNSLSLAGLLILGANPNQLFDIGFQLSFLSVASILSLGLQMRSLCSKRLLQRRFLRRLINTFFISCSAWLAVLGVIAYRFRIISPITVLANLVVVPFMGIVVALGFLLLSVGGLLPQFVGIVSIVAEFALFILVKIIYLFSIIPGSYIYLKGLSFPVVFSYYIIGAGLVIWLNKKVSKVL